MPKTVNRSKHPRFEMRLPPPSDEALEKLSEHRMKPKAEVIRDLVIAEAEQLSLIDPQS